MKPNIEACMVCIADMLTKHHNNWVKIQSKDSAFDNPQKRQSFESVCEQQKKSHKSKFSRWFYHLYQREKKIPCWGLPNSTRDWRQIRHCKYQPLNLHYDYILIDSAPENCPYALEHLVSANVK